MNLNKILIKQNKLISDKSRTEHDRRFLHGLTSLYLTEPQVTY